MKLFKIAFKCLAALVALVVLAVVVLLVVIDPNDYKPEITKATKDATGRDLTIDGDISWSFFPRLGFVIGHTELSNAKGFNSRVFAEIDKVDIGIQIKPLFSGEVKIDVIYLDGMKANLEVAANGKTNWDDLAGGSTAEAAPATTETVTEEAAPAEGGNALANLPPISLGGIEITNAHVTYTDLAGGVAANLQDFNFKTGEIVLWEPIQFEGGFVVDNKYPQVNVGIDYAGTLVADVPANQFGVNGFTLNIDSKGEVIPNGALMVALAADVSANTAKEVAELEKLTIKFDETTISGTASVNGFAKPAVKFAVNVDQLDADRYIPKTEEAPAGSGEAVSIEDEAPAASTAPAAQEDVVIALPMQTLRDLNMDGELTVGKFSVMNLKTQNFKAVLSAHDGLINLQPLGIELYEGVFDGGVKLDARGEEPKYGVTAKLNNLAIGPLAKDFADFDLLNGRGLLDMEITTGGDRVSELKRGLNGLIKVALSDASIQGDVLASFNKVVSLLGAEDKVYSSKGDGKTYFETVDAWVNIKDGVATTKNLNMKGAGLNITGGGSFDIPTEYVDADPRVSIGKYGCPVILKGPLAELDYAGAAKRAIPDCLSARLDAEKEKLKQKLEEEKRKAKEKLDQLKAEEEAKLKAKIKEEEERAKKKLEDKLKNKLKDLF